MNTSSSRSGSRDYSEFIDEIIEQIHQIEEPSNINSKTFSQYGGNYFEQVIEPRMKILYRVKEIPWKSHTKELYLAVTYKMKALIKGLSCFDDYHLVQGYIQECGKVIKSFPEKYKYKLYFPYLMKCIDLLECEWDLDAELSKLDKLCYTGIMRVPNQFYNEHVYSKLIEYINKKVNINPAIFVDQKLLEFPRQHINHFLPGLIKSIKKNLKPGTREFSIKKFKNFVEGLPFELQLEVLVNTVQSKYSVIMLASVELLKKLPSEYRKDVEHIIPRI